jgi:hypothetical protein
MVPGPGLRRGGLGNSGAPVIETLHDGAGIQVSRGESVIALHSERFSVDCICTHRLVLAARVGWTRAARKVSLQDALHLEQSSPQQAFTNVPQVPASPENLSHQ